MPAWDRLLLAVPHHGGAEIFHFSFACREYHKYYQKRQVSTVASGPLEQLEGLKRASMTQTHPCRTVWLSVNADKIA